MKGTIAQKILAKASHKEEVNPGDFLVVDVSTIFVHDGTAALVFQAMNEMGLEKPADSSDFVMCIDHAAPSPAAQMSDIHNEMRRYAERNGVKLYDVGYGICHQIIPSEGRVRPGTVVIGADSHSVTHGAFNAFSTGVGSTDAAIAILTGKIWLMVPETVKMTIEGELRKGVMSKDLILSIVGTVGADGLNYMAIEYHGELLERLSVDSRMTITNMGAEMGAKASLMTVSDKTSEWLRERIQEGINPVFPDEDASYHEQLLFSADEIEPMVAEPPNVDNVRPVSEIGQVEIDQVFIGSCTNGRIEDLEIAAKILRGKRSKARCIVIPASREVYLQALEKGILETLLRSGCAVGPPTCGPCVGAHMGLLGKGEVAISTGNRNFPGRMGDRDSKIYLASPATAAASAVEGKISDPRKYLE